MKKAFVIMGICMFLPACGWNADKILDASVNAQTGFIEVKEKPFGPNDGFCYIAGIRFGFEGKPSGNPHRIYNADVRVSENGDNKPQWKLNTNHSQMDEKSTAIKCIQMRTES